LKDDLDAATGSISNELSLLNGSILNNVDNISTNSGNISLNSADISTNSGNIATNASNISTNTTAIGNRYTKSETDAFLDTKVNTGSITDDYSLTGSMTVVSSKGLSDSNTNLLTTIL
jgi:hypothetical protein